MSEISIYQEDPDHSVVIDTENAVIFSAQPNTEALVSQEQEKPGYREIGLDEPAAVITLGVLATVALVPAFLHARHDRMRREREERNSGKE
jgi:hypothetical protein